jgi:hypothetical protein
MACTSRYRSARHKIPWGITRTWRNPRWSKNPWGQQCQIASSAHRTVTHGWAVRAGIYSYSVGVLSRRACVTSPPGETFTGGAAAGCRCSRDESGSDEEEVRETHRGRVSLIRGGKTGGLGRTGRAGGSGSVHILEAGYICCPKDVILEPLSSSPSAPSFKLKSDRKAA